MAPASSQLRQDRSVPNVNNEIDLDLLETECISICQEMIRIPSVNHGDGVGDERAIADYVALKLKEVGIDSELIVTGENRVNVVARIPGVDQARPGLVVHGHLDVVPVNAEDW
jgi:acetylornithine deacetylase/succinyl-diaminopimelate desuccinylase-like protein